mgnify:CR=1 FL=1
MSLTISNNGAVSTASMNLGKNQAKLQQSIQGPSDLNFHSRHCRT